MTVAITEGKLDFGPWEQIFYGEFDGQRDKRVLVKIIGAWNTRSKELQLAETRFVFIYNSE